MMEKQHTIGASPQLRDAMQTALCPYEAPVTRRTGVETEGGFCASEASIKIEEEIIEVEDYTEITNEITFD